MSDLEDLTSKLNCLSGKELTMVIKNMEHPDYIPFLPLFKRETFENLIKDFHSDNIKLDVLSEVQKRFLGGILFDLMSKQDHNLYDEPSWFLEGDGIDSIEEAIMNHPEIFLS